MNSVTNFVTFSLSFVHNNRDLFFFFLPLTKDLSGDKEKCNLKPFTQGYPALPLDT